MTFSSPAPATEPKESRPCARPHLGGPPERFSESRTIELLAAAQIRSFDQAYLPQFVKILNTGSGAYCKSERARSENSNGKLKEDRERWTAWLRRLQKRCRELAHDIADADDDLFQNLEASLPATLELEKYAAVRADGYRWLFEFRQVKSSGSDIDDVLDLAVEIATLGRLAEHLLSEQLPRKIGAPSISHLDAFVLGIALGYERLTGRHFTHQKFAVGRWRREPVTPCDHLVQLIADDLAKIVGFSIRPSSVETACARAVKSLRALREHQRTQKNSGGIDQDFSDRKIVNPR